jgi:hypothetical protein
MWQNLVLLFNKNINCFFGVKAKSTHNDKTKHLSFSLSLSLTRLNKVSVRHQGVTLSPLDQ